MFPLFPRYYIVVYDKDGELADHALYYNGMKCRLAYRHVLRPQEHGGLHFHTLYREDGWYQGFEAKRGPIEVFTGMIPDWTFHSVSKEQLRQMACKSLPYELLKRAADHERRYLQCVGRERGEAFKRKYLWSFRDFFPGG